MIRSAPGLPATLEAINGKYGRETIQTATEFICHGRSQRYVPGRLYSLYMAIGAIPLGRIIEIHGDAGSGKTALALHLAQCIGGPVLYLDADCGLSPLYLQGGPEMFIMHPETIEDAMEITRIAAEGFPVIVIDTLTALPTRSDLSFRIGEICDGGGSAAQILSHALPILIRKLRQTGCTLILVNQMRENPHIIIGKRENPTGGRAIGYYAALRLQVHRIESNRTGQRVLILVRKCKYGAPGRRANAGIIYGEGLTTEEALEAAVRKSHEDGRKNARR